MKLGRDLYGNNTLENLGTDMMLESRNKNIVRLLEEKGDIIENRHTGIVTMRDEMKKIGLPAPEFKSLRGDFKVIFRKETVEVEKQNVIRMPQNGQKHTENCTENFTENCTENFTENFTEKELQLLKVLKGNSYSTQIELANCLNVSRRTISTIISHLKNKGIIHRVGSDKKGYWKIK